MPSSSAVLRFAAEFFTFLVAVAGAAVVFIRPRLLGVHIRSRLSLGLGFLAVAAAAFLHGSLLFEGDDLLVIAVRLGGILLLAVGTLGWRSDPGSPRVVWASLVLLAVAEVAALGGLTGPAGVARALGVLGLAALLGSSARRSIPARVAVSTAATLLVVVLAVSVALSFVITGNVERDALDRVGARAQSEAFEVQDGARTAAIRSAKLIAGSIQGSIPDVAQQVSQNPGPSPALQDAIDKLASADLLVSDGPVLYATEKGALIVLQGIDRAGAQALVGSRAVAAASTGQDVSSAIEAVGTRALAVAAVPVKVGAPEGQRTVGVVVATHAIDDGYLARRAGSDRDVSLAVVDRDRRLAAHGPRLPEEEVLQVGRAALRSSSGRASSIAGDAFLAARVVPAPGSTPALAVVSSAPTAVVDDARNSLFRTLFVVALLTALGAFLAALVVGERIGVGLRRLTEAAARIQEGDFGTRVGVSSPDELGILGSTFDSMAGSIQDLTTELRQTNEEEVRLRSRLEAVVGGMGEAVVAVDAAGHITTFNEAAEELFGTSTAQAEGRPVAAVVRVAAEDGTDLTPRLANPTPGRWRSAAVAHRADAVEVPVLLSAGGLPGPSGGVGGGVYVLRDVRPEREAERAKADLLANISHELRTPLVPIKGYAKLLRERRLTKAKAEDALAAIYEAAEQLERVVGRLLEVAAGDRREDVRRETVEVAPMVESVVERWKEREGDRHPITRRVARNLPTMVADRRLLEESLDELVDNAVKFSPEGSRILISARRAENGTGPVVEISVDDVGIGIDEEKLGRIFEDFAQGDSSATRTFGGLGLGLSVVRHAVAAHGGQLVCESEPGKGSKFSMILPLEPRARRDG
ncbi:MAG TPA: ATP-binding protein [Acidimicrobiales bacterium]|nr:ATP-binding protein [Acidimicrobiales bacterium]